MAIEDRAINSNHLWNRNYTNNNVMQLIQYIRFPKYNIIIHEAFGNSNIKSSSQRATKNETNTLPYPIYPK